MPEELLTSTEVSLTPSAAKEINKLMVQNNIPNDQRLRVGVTGGGCSGLSYSLSFDNPKESDIVVQTEGLDLKERLSLKKVTIYTDGACKGNPGKGAWAFVITGDGIESECYGFENITTNNRMELVAAISALSVLTEPSQVTLFSDSTYLCYAYTKRWITKWKKNRWKTTEKKDVKNRDLWERLDTLVSQHEVSFVKIKGHAGDKLNERCDFLANQAIDTRSSSTLYPLSM
ncbi:hypothetical protein CHS0354_024090 [Potamilus streckersoni]|uniref:ribonuclease H n=1 Tax=Potamilus streckersoni TaxID=2493646 RepID=A0AAE0VMV8_9BIVA|nr:hypothetical protein CHS0354_024090 [Potamilus streckersoni]